jgi:sugar transferase (PEP-CTERM/EpsH1 system associated)
MIREADKDHRREKPPLIVHIVMQLDIGGLENGLVNLINRVPPERYCHAIVCLKGHTDFRRRIVREDVGLFDLNKKEGQDLGIHIRLWQVLRRTRPALVHTRNLAALESIVPAFLAGVPRRVHGEHGWDMHDIDGSKRRYYWLRRVLSPLIHRFITVSRGLESYLVQQVKVPPDKIIRICNGVDTDVFYPCQGSKRPLPFKGWSEDALIIGTVGRMETVKDPVTLARAFLRLGEILPHAEHRLRLVMVGDGSLRDRVWSMLEEGGAGSMVWLAGRRDDVPTLLRGLDIFVLPSLAEGISNTILESMASGLPVVATRVGGNPELVEDGVTGALVPPENPEAMARAIAAYVVDAEKRKRHARAAREKVEWEFSLGRMVEGYLSVYDGLLARGK